MNSKLEIITSLYNDLVQAGAFRNKKEFAQILGVSYTGLTRALNGDPQYLTDSLISKVAALANQAPSEPTSENTIPLIPILAQAGHLSDFADSVAEYDCERITSPIQGVDVAIPVYGDSMTPEYPSGSIVFVKRVSDSFIEWGKTYILDTVNGSIIKYLAPSEKEDCIRCISGNPDPKYAPFDVPMADIKAIFKVVMCMSMK